MFFYFKCILLTSIVFLWISTINILPVKADMEVSPSLKEQVLQIIRDYPEVIIKSLEDYQRSEYEKKLQARKKLFNNIKTKPQVVIGNSPTKGSSKQNIILIEFADFQCPYCAEVQKTLKRFMNRHQEKVTLVYKNLPLVDLHPEAMNAAKAAYAASLQNKFWEYHDILFAKQKKLSEVLYIEIAQQLELDISRFNQDRRSDIVNQAINQDIDLAEQLGVQSTPFFIMNKEVLSGSFKLSEIEKIFSSIENDSKYN